MKKFLKKTLAVCSVLSLTATMGFAAACNPEPEDNNETDPPHVHSYTEWCNDDLQHWKKCAEDDAISEKSNHEYDKGVCECGDKLAAQEFSPGALIELNVKGETKAAFIGGLGTFKLTMLNLPAGRSYTFKFGSQEVVVDSEHKSFDFDCLGEEVTIYKPNTSSAFGDGTDLKKVSGVLFKVIPAGDYSEGGAADTLSFKVEEVSKRLSVGDNNLTVSGSVINSFSTSKYGSHRFIFNITNDDEYTVEVCGEKHTVNKTDKEFTVDMQRDKEYLFQREVSTFSIRITAAAANTAATEFGLYILQPKTIETFAYNSMMALSSARNPEIKDYYNGEYEFVVSNAQKTEEEWYIEAGKTYDFYGSVYYSDFELYVGSEKVGEFTDVDPASEESVEFEVSFEVKEEHFNADKSISFTLKLLNEEKFTVMAKFGVAPVKLDNHILQLSKGGTGFVTECKAADIGEDGKYTYTFTAPQDGWYMFELYGTTGVKYTVGTDKAGELSLSKPIKEVVQLAKDDVLTVVLEDGMGKKWNAGLNDFELVEVTPVGATIKVTETEEPATGTSIEGVYNLSSTQSGAVEHVVSESGWYEFKTSWADGFDEPCLDGEKGCSSWEMLGSYNHYKVYLEAGQKFKVTGYGNCDGETYTITKMLTTGETKITLKEADIAAGGKEISFNGKKGKTYVITVTEDVAEEYDKFCTAYCGSEFILGWHPTDWDAPYKTSHEFTLTSGDILTFKFTAIMEADCEYTVTITEVTI